MSGIRQAILKQMRNSGLTIYQVAKIVEGKVPQRTVYAFLSGEKDAGTKTASKIMEALGLAIIGPPDTRQGRRKKRLNKK